MMTVESEDYLRHVFLRALQGLPPLPIAEAEPSNVCSIALARTKRARSRAVALDSQQDRPEHQPQPSRCVE
jgi:hypothetical protein